MEHVSKAATVMAGLVPAIHVLSAAKEDVDGRDKRGHDDCWLRRRSLIATMYAQPGSGGTSPGHDKHIYSKRNTL
jgi:hypothetical protein